MSPHATSWRDPPKPVATLEPLPADPRVIPCYTRPAIPMRDGPFALLLLILLTLAYGVGLYW